MSAALGIKPAILDPVAQTTTLVDYPGRAERFLPGTSLLRCRISPSNPHILVVAGVLAAVDIPSIVIWSVPIDDPTKATHEIAIPLTSPTVTSLDISPDCRSVMVVVTSHDRSEESAILVSSGVTLPDSGNPQSASRTPGSSSCGGSSVGSKLTPQSTESRPCLQSEVVVWVELAGGLPEPPTAIAWIEYSPLVVSSGKAFQEEPVTYICMGFLTGEVTLIDADGADGGSVESQFNCRMPVTNIEVIPIQGGPPILLVHLSASPCFFLLMTAVDGHTGVLRLEAQVLPLPCPDPRSVRFFSDNDAWYISTLSNCGCYVYMSILPEGDSTAAVTPVARIPTASLIPISDHCLVSSSHDSSQRRSILVASLGGSVALMTASAAGCDNIVLAVVPYGPSPTVRLLAPTTGEFLTLSSLCFATVSPATLYRLEFQDRERIQAAVEACVTRAAVECLPRSTQGSGSRQFFDTGFPLMCQALSDLVDLDDICLSAGLRVMDTPDHSPYERLSCCLLIWRQRYSSKPVPFPVMRALLLHVGAQSGGGGVGVSSDNVTPEGLGNYRLLVDGFEPIIPFEYFVGVISPDGRALQKPGIFNDHWGPGSDLGSGGMQTHPTRRLWILELTLGMLLGRQVTSAFVIQWLDKIEARPMVYSSSRRGFRLLVEHALRDFRLTWSDVAEVAKSLGTRLGGIPETVARFVGLPPGCDVGVPVILAVLASTCALGEWRSAEKDTVGLVKRVGETVEKCWIAPGLSWSRHSDCLLAVLRLMRRVWELIMVAREAQLESLEIKPVMKKLPESDCELHFKRILKTMEDRVDQMTGVGGSAWTSSEDGLYRIANQARWLMQDNGGSKEDFIRIQLDEDLGVLRKLAMILRRDGRLWRELPWSQRFRLRLIREVVGGDGFRGA
ncbi:hypothetical protein FOZ61_006861 [Perkinsus olseni]|uniref:Uncharacterized protein n=1 Tax=Perkinsus olseni TaxID=32597 RepID=A0A7J6MHM9_PEROL|nr:hypothetical protein FOZ61_006861 [Perkinsus olseni]KAF4673368.1 hypothetical protein FOL46_007408 [Perkinsus olseni]